MIRLALGKVSNDDIQVVIPVAQGGPGLRSEFVSSPHEVKAIFWNDRLAYSSQQPSMFIDVRLLEPELGTTLRYPQLDGRPAAKQGDSEMMNFSWTTVQPVDGVMALSGFMLDLTEYALMERCGLQIAPGRRSSLVEGGFS